MCFNARMASDFILLAITETPRRALPYSWPWVSSRGDDIKNMVTLSIWECGSHLYQPQELEVYFYSTRFEHKAKKMAIVDQRLWARSALSPWQGQCGCRCIELQGSLQLPTSYPFDWRRVQHPSVTGFIVVQHHSHTYLEGWDHCSSEEWWGHRPYQMKNARGWSQGCLFSWGCEGYIVV
jgi:hypothetical protein